MYYCQHLTPGPGTCKCGEQSGFVIVCFQDLSDQGEDCQRDPDGEGYMGGDQAEVPLQTYGQVLPEW